MQRQGGSVEQLKYPIYCNIGYLRYGGYGLCVAQPTERPAGSLEFLRDNYLAKHRRVGQQSLANRLHAVRQWIRTNAPDSLITPANFTGREVSLITP